MKFSQTTFCRMLLGFFLITSVACSDHPQESITMIDSGSWYSIGFEWPHDGKPYETEHFIVFSDAASLESRKYLADAGEEVFFELRTQFEVVDDTIFRYPDGQNKIHIYAYKEYFPKEWGGQAYYGGYMIYSPDHVERGKEGHTDPEIYIPVVKHELTHVMQNLILGKLDNSLVDVWLSEGLAETISQSNPDKRIENLESMTELISKFGSLNPISMHLYEYPDVENVVAEYYYPMFQLAVTYLTDPEGGGRRMRDLKDLLIDVKNGKQFSVAFEERWNIGLEDFEDQFFVIMEDYLKSK